MNILCVLLYRLGTIPYLIYGVMIDVLVSCCTPTLTLSSKVPVGLSFFSTKIDGHATAVVILWKYEFVWPDMQLYWCRRYTVCILLDGFDNTPEHRASRLVPETGCAAR